MEQPSEKTASHQQNSFLNHALNYLIDHYTLVFLFITLSCFLYKITFTSSKMTEAFLISFLTWNVGVRGLVAFVANWFPPFADQIAISYGWPLQSSFQREIASAEGAFGVLGILCNWFTDGFWVATVVAVSFCWFFSELGGLIKIARRKKDPSYQLNDSLHFGMRLDLIFSILLLVCLIFWKKGF